MKSIKVTLGTGLLTAISLYSNAANNSSKPNIIFINAVLLRLCGSQDDDLVPLFPHRTSPSLS